MAAGDFTDSLDAERQLSTDPTQSRADSRFLVVLEARVKFRLRRELSLLLDYTLEGANRRLELHLATEYDVVSGLPRPILIVTAKVSGTELNESANWVVGFIRSMLNCISVATNTAIDDAQPTYGADITTGPLKSRKFFQAASQIVRTPAPSNTRLIDYEAAEAFSRVALGSDPLLRDRLNRAVQQYVLALRHWNPEQMVLSVGHAFMAAEALTPIAKRSLGKSDQELADLEKADRFIKYTNRARDIPNAADNRARRQVTFHGDSVTLRGARKLSDGLEHGFGDYDELKQLAHEHGAATLKHVRQAIIELSEVPPDIATKLLSARFEEPVPLDSLLGVFGHFIDDPPTDRQEDYEAEPLDLSTLTAQVERYDEVTGEYQTKASSSMTLRGPLPVAVDEIRAGY